MVFRLASQVGVVSLCVHGKLTLRLAKRCPSRKRKREHKEVLFCSRWKAGKRSTMRKLALAKVVCMAAVLCVAGAVGSSAQTLTTVANFDGSNGNSPYLGALVQGTDGNFFGTFQCRFPGGAVMALTSERRNRPLARAAFSWTDLSEVFRSYGRVMTSFGDEGRTNFTFRLALACIVSDTFSFARSIFLFQ